MKNLDKLSDLPTDNLYKFMALFGLVLIVAGAVLQWRTISPVVRGVARLEVLKEALEGKADSLVRSHERSTVHLRQYEALYNEMDEWMPTLRAEINRHEAEALDALDQATPEASDRLKEAKELLNAISANLRKGDVLLAYLQAEIELLHEVQSDQIQLGKTFGQEMVDARSDSAVAQLAVVAIWTMLMTGGLLSSVGFLLWYYKLQRYLDREVAQFGKTMEPIDETADKAKATDDALG